MKGNTLEQTQMHTEHTHTHTHTQTHMCKAPERQGRTHADTEGGERERKR
jgi:hypothetical protein